MQVGGLLRDFRQAFVAGAGQCCTSRATCLYVLDLGLDLDLDLDRTESGWSASTRSRLRILSITAWRRGGRGGGCTRTLISPLCAAVPVQSEGKGGGGSGAISVMQELEQMHAEELRLEQEVRPPLQGISTVQN